jgi:hypothetical protein
MSTRLSGLTVVLMVIAVGIVARNIAWMVRVRLGTRDGHGDPAGRAEYLGHRARTEVINRMLIFGERHLRTVPNQYGAHYNGRRAHRTQQLRPGPIATAGGSLIVNGI